MKNLLPLLLMIISIEISCQDKQSLKEYHSAINYADKELSGNGWELLKKNAAQASVVFVGEDHGLAEIPLLTKNLAFHLNENGFNTYLGEIGPLSAQRLCTKMESGEHREWLKNAPLAIPFINWKEELELLEDLNQINMDIHGIDQEFLFSPIIHLSSLENLAGEHKDEIQGMIKKEKKATNQFLSGGNYLDLFMISSIEKDFDDLREMFQQEEAITIINELQSSFHVYRTMMNGKGKQSNELRSQMMRDHFQQVVSKNSNSKVMIKLGAVHCYRENAPTSVEEIGEYVAKKGNSFHILVLGNQGTINNYTAQSGFNESQKEVPYNIKKRFPVDLSDFLNYTEQNQWSYFDLKAIRNSKKQFVDEVRSLASAYDALIIIPEVTASTNLE